MTFQLTKQEWFDAAWQRAKTGLFSMTETKHCTYDKSLNGGCFIGFALPEEVYNDIDDMALTANELVDQQIIGVSDCREESVFLDGLQQIHDGVALRFDSELMSPEEVAKEWREELMSFASSHNLEIHNAPTA